MPDMGLFGTPLRAPPANAFAEQALLGALLANNRTLDKVVEVIDPDAFADPINGRIYEVIRDRVTQGLLADAVTLRNVLDGAGILDEVGGPAYLAQLLSAMVAPLLAADYAQTIRDCWLRRQLIDVAMDISALAFGADATMDAQAQIAAAERALAELGTGGRKGAVLSSIGGAFRALVEWVGRVQRGEVKASLMTGITGVDQATGGLYPSEMTILAGVPGSGKSALAAQIATAVAERGDPVLLLTREMSTEQLLARIAGQRVGVSARALMEGRFDMLTAERLVHASQEVAAWPLDIYDCRRTPLRVLGAKTRMLLQRKPAALVILDHLLVANPDEQADAKRRSGQDASNVSAAAYAQREIAGDFKVPFLVLSARCRDRQPTTAGAVRPCRASNTAGRTRPTRSCSFIVPLCSATTNRRNVANASR